MNVEEKTKTRGEFILNVTTVKDERNKSATSVHFPPVC